MAERIRDYLQLDEYSDVDELPLNGYLNVVPLVSPDMRDHLVKLDERSLQRAEICNDHHCLVVEEIEPGQKYLFAERNTHYLPDPIEELVSDPANLKDANLRELALPHIKAVMTKRYQECGLTDKEISGIVSSYGSLTRKQLGILANEAYQYREELLAREEVR